MKPIIFCDFDGTITNTDNIISIMKTFAPPEWEKLKDDVLQQKISISSGVGKMFSLLDSGLKADIIQFVKETAHIRPGFREFVKYTEQAGIPLYIVSGGMDFFIAPLLKDILPTDAVFCNNAHFDKKKIYIEWPHACDDQCDNECGCCKPTIMRQMAGADDYIYVIGDSVTDFEAAKQADLVIARDILLEKCVNEGLPHHGFETFYDVLDILKQREEVKA
ncbi:MULTISPECIES: 2-hydroxy-3-keto-5-methylthiopentenyl-1-phosphate phosphatase [Peribacillus]|uniref:2-hydroxy-3-keto-5-methylthiopentenyl-1-phosphate phosphatase n=1 Tax=Peribacillus simplex TaxID=1478 RepID=A0A120GR58_9BACI|nr:2-hydroxy-3-keto-5-methylthiopentenyl-1-phosphate phosphatase [Peribacillus simplex]KWW22407.1 2-hydroxy-3-keto-5-methylthiopentenyl-1-phosphate phosphatase [Peribacillus simplex]